MKILSVVGARPNFMKIGPFVEAINLWNNKNPKINIDHKIVHTGQHYDNTLSGSFFKDLNIPKPEINLGIGSGSHAEQVGKTMIAFEKILKKENPDWVVVVGDVNATLACSVTAKKEGISLCHIEAGLRSNDFDMPEEINRLVTDRLSDLLLTPDDISSKNLYKEGENINNIIFVGNIMIDALEKNINTAKKLDKSLIIKKNIMQKNKSLIIPEKFALVTLHRPSNVDNYDIINSILDLLINRISKKIPIIWPMHPRTKKQIEKFDLKTKLFDCPDIYILKPIGYLDMIKMNMSSKLILTDSGGIQEECCILGTPCLTLRWNTERPITLEEHGGLSTLVGNDINRIYSNFKRLINNKNIKKVFRPKNWDGKTAARCVEAIINYDKNTKNRKN